VVFCISPFSQGSFTLFCCDDELIVYKHTGSSLPGSVRKNSSSDRAESSYRLKVSQRQVNESQVCCTQVTNCLSAQAATRSTLAHQHLDRDWRESEIEITHPRSPRSQTRLPLGSRSYLQFNPFPSSTHTLVRMSSIAHPTVITISFTARFSPQDSPLPLHKILIYFQQVQFSPPHPRETNILV